MLTENWSDTKEALLEGLEGTKRSVTAQLLENEKAYILKEDVAAGATGTGNFDRMDKIFMPLIRRVTPATIAMELVGVQPMNAPIGVVFTQRARYSNAPAGSGLTVNDEASGVKVYEKYSLIAAGEAYTASDTRTDREIMDRLESEGGNEMNIEVIKKTVEPKTRKLQAKWTIEAEQDSKALHSLDLEAELVAAVSDELIREQDRELLGELTNLAGTVKSFDFSLADGRYASEKFTALVIGISDLSNKIAFKCKRGGASWAVVSPDMLVALRHANNGSFVPATPTTDINPSATLFAGTLNGSIRVFVDNYAATNTILMGYKGSSAMDTGFVFAPYIPIMKSNVVIDPTTYDPRIGLMTRYGLVSFTDTNTDLGNSSDYYARGTITNLTLGF